MPRYLRRALLILGVGGLFLAVAAAALWYLEGENAEIRTGGVLVGGGGSIGGPFSLVNQDGERVTEASFAGKYLLIYFGFTNCPDACPQALLAMSRAMERLPAETAAKLQPLFFTVDPERDTPEQVKLYLENFDPTFVGLTGTPEETARAAASWRVMASKVPDETTGSYGIQHGTLIYLMGPDGSFLAHYPHDLTADELTQGLTKVVR